jgi:tRNA(Ile)-lysidine synthase
LRWPRVAVAASGGRDSTALLHCTVQAARALGLQVVALHVHHGLHAAADRWLAQVRGQARRWGAEFACQHLLTAPGRGDSVEAWARRERYWALAELARTAGCDLVLLAHHRRDQAETWLLQALRGASAAGLAAMPRQVQRDGLWWSRPWLDLPREAIEAYVRRHRLRFVEDPSNADPRYARNRLRLQVLPALQAAFPGSETALCAAATHAQQARLLAAEVALLDLPAVQQGEALGVSAWLALPPARRRNALQGWLAQVLGRGAPQSLLDRLLDELPRHSLGRWGVPGAELRLYRGLLRTAPPTPERPPAPPPQALDLSRPGGHVLAGWPGHFEVAPAAQDGAPAALLRDLVARDRSGGERFRLAAAGAARSLKKQYQVRGVPAWERAGPLLFTPAGELVFAPGMGVDAAWQAPPGAPQLGITWVPDATGQRQHAR